MIPNAQHIPDEVVARDIEEFVERFTPARMRWAYCSDCMKGTFKLRSGEVYGFRKDSHDACARVLGLSHVTRGSLARRLALFDQHGFDEAHAKLSRFGGKGLDVGPLPAWCVGHVYFLRPATCPHVVKVGFSRRVRERIADIRSKIGVDLVLDRCDVGTLLDEAWWHHDWRDYRIAGEWFFDPSTRERTVPEFLAVRSSEAA